MSVVLEAQELTVKSWKPWENEDGLVRDPHGNYKGSVTFDKYASEPVDATFKEQPNTGDVKYGSIEEYQTKAGKTRLKFKRADRPDGQQGASAKGGYHKSPEERDGIFRCNALTNAATIIASQGTGKTAEATLDMADKLYAWLKNESITQGMVDKVYGDVPDEMPPDFLQ